MIAADGATVDEAEEVVAKPQQLQAVAPQLRDALVGEAVEDAGGVAVDTRDAALAGGNNSADVVAVAPGASCAADDGVEADQDADVALVARAEVALVAWVADNSGGEVVSTEYMGSEVALIAEVRVEAAAVVRSRDAALADDSSSAGEVAGALDLACAADDVEVVAQNEDVVPVVHEVVVVVALAA